MAKSKIIKELANGKIDIQTALKRAKVLFAELENDSITEWINNELMGYPDYKSLPSYRVYDGTVKGSYMKGSMAVHIEKSNVSLPLGSMPEEVKRKLLEICFYDSIGAIKDLYESSQRDGSNICKQIPADYFSLFNKYNNDPYMIISSAYVELGYHNIYDIISVVENKLLDALILLEKEFGCLDELDIDISDKNEGEIKRINEKIQLVLLDQSISIGNNNNIKSSDFSSQNQKSE